jgi:hypothetical protein
VAPSPTQRSTPCCSRSSTLLKRPRSRRPRS